MNSELKKRNRKKRARASSLFIFESLSLYLFANSKAQEEVSKKNVCRSHYNQQLSSKCASETTDWYRLNHHIKSLQPFWIWVSWKETHIGTHIGGGRLEGDRVRVCDGEQ